MRIALLISDCGDGSSCIRFFRDIMLAEHVANDDEYCELYYGNDGYPTIIDVQEDFVPPKHVEWSDKYFAGRYEF